MNLFSARLVITSFIALSSALAGSQAFAVLGQAPSQLVFVPVGATAPSSNRHLLTQVKASSLYTVHDSQMASGTSIREFVTPANVVFAVIWRGPVLPDLSALLGEHFTTFTAEVEATRTKASRGTPVRFERDGLTLRSGGRMRNFTGYAYLKDTIPVGININDLLQ